METGRSAWLSQHQPLHMGQSRGLVATEEGAAPFHQTAFFIYLPLLDWAIQKILIWIYWQLAEHDNDDDSNYVYTYTHRHTPI